MHVIRIRPARVRPDNAVAREAARHVAAQVVPQVPHAQLHRGDRAGVGWHRLGALQVAQQPEGADSAPDAVFALSTMLFSAARPIEKPSAPSAACASASTDTSSVPAAADAAAAGAPQQELATVRA